MVRIDLPSGAKQPDPHLWSLKVLIGAAVLMSHRMTVSSADPVRMDLPSGEKQMR